MIVNLNLKNGNRQFLLAFLTMVIYANIAASFALIKISTQFAGTNEGNNGGKNRLKDVIREVVSEGISV